MSSKIKWQKEIRRTARALALKMLPRVWAHRWIRQSLNLAVPKAHSQLRFEIISNTSDLKEALALVQQNFEKEGYAQKTGSGLRLTPYHLSPETLVIAAKYGSQIVATLSVIPRTSLGLPLESSFDVESFLQGKGKVVEISALAVNPAFKGQQGEVLYNLMKYMYHCNVDVLKANTEVIGVNPKMVPLYDAILLFERIPGTGQSAYDFANGAPVIPMSFDLDRAIPSYAKIYSGKVPHLNLMEFFLAPLPPQFVLPASHELDQILPQRNAKLLEEVLSWDADLIKSLNPQQRLALENSYAKWPECAQLIRSASKGDT